MRKSGGSRPGRNSESVRTGDLERFQKRVEMFTTVPRPALDNVDPEVAEIMEAEAAQCVPACSRGGIPVGYEDHFPAEHDRARLGDRADEGVFELQDSEYER